MRLLQLFTIAGLLVGCADGKGLLEECSSSEECESSCCMPSTGEAPFCSVGNSCMALKSASTAPTGSTSGKCTSSYQGVTGDVQVMTQCMSVYNYLCIQKNPTAATQNCKVYASLGATVSCRYC